MLVGGVLCLYGVLARPARAQCDLDRSCDNTSFDPPISVPSATSSGGGGGSSGGQGPQWPYTSAAGATGRTPDDYAGAFHPPESTNQIAQTLDNYIDKVSVACCRIPS
jgi:hypothetical protein